MAKQNKAERKRRLRKLISEYRDGQRDFRISKVTGNEVVFRIDGILIDFRLNDGRITRGQASNRYLSDDDWAFLFTFAEELMQAAFNGYKRGGNAETTATETPDQLSFDFHQ